jgi:hypothetical protein
MHTDTRKTWRQPQLLSADNESKVARSVYVVACDEIMQHCCAVQRRSRVETARMRCAELIAACFACRRATIHAPQQTDVRFLQSHMAKVVSSFVCEWRGYYGYGSVGLISIF